MTTASAARRPTVAAYVADLRANANAYHTEAIDYPAFKTRNLDLWIAIERRGAGFAEQVRGRIRRALGLVVTEG